MQTLRQIYRSNYAGENVVTTLTLEGGNWQPETEYIANNVFNTFTTNQSIVFGNGESRLEFDLVHIANHKAGLGGANKLQTYGCNGFYRDFTPDFLVAVGNDIVKEIAESGYCDNNIVYANGQHLLEYPNKFYLVPQNLAYDAGALAVYMACFDGHKKIFLMGFDHYDIIPGQINEVVNNVYKNTNGYLNTDDRQNHVFWHKTLLQVMTTYTDVEFVRVMPTPNWVCSSEYISLPNFRQIDMSTFVTEADIG
jgi:hypothetical protein